MSSSSVAEKAVVQIEKCCQKSEEKENVPVSLNMIRNFSDYISHYPDKSRIKYLDPRLGRGEVPRRQENDCEWYGRDEAECEGRNCTYSNGKCSDPCNLYTVEGAGSCNTADEDCIWSGKGCVGKGVIRGFKQLELDQQNTALKRWNERICQMNLNLKQLLDRKMRSLSIELFGAEKYLRD